MAAMTQALIMGYGDQTPGGADDVLVAEDGTAFLAEDADNIILEDGD